MSYVVLARKYRSRNFEEMVGQDHVVRALTHALEQGRLHHAYLFTGTRGIGKTTVSRILAKCLNCIGPDGNGGITARPCGVCTACREIDADRYIDYTELDAASNRGIDEARDLIERASYKPSVGRFKVFMIDEAHQLTKDAFNALLKTLEEPPEYLKFVLATTDPEKMLPTVLSRCLQFNLRPMAPQTVAEHLENVLAKENVPVEPGALRLLSRAARGSMRDALSLTDQAIAYGGGKLEEPAVRAMLGSVDRRHAQRLIEALASRDGPALLAEAEGLRSQGLSAAGTLEEIARLLQQMAVEQVVPGALDTTDPDTDAARQLAPLLAPDETQLLYSMALQGRAELSLAPDEYAGLVMVLLRFLAFPANGGGFERAADRTGASNAPAPASAALQARVAERARAPVPVPAPVARPPAPAVTRPAVPAPAPAPRPAVATQASAKVSDEPPPWMDEAPFEDAAPARAAEPPVPAPEKTPITLRPSPAATPAVPAPAPAAVPAVPRVQRTALGDRWAEIVAALAAANAIAALVRELAMQAELTAIEAAEGGGERWCLRVERETLRAPTLAEKLQAAVVTHAGLNIKIEVSAGVPDDSPARRDAEAAALRQREAEAIIHNDPLVQAMLAQFSTARIVPGSIRPA
ncbi:MAG TPA: DNA polymerase III subunit gamma/tau [Ideonella sp.]|uniref:DNA polymerase III subunit gamma/tau n=1 Tax=Ideonella sp. TaxID=1929293 RepID=UPI002E358C5E|nr:DNA polymerase III subunit gamma/tau [Ideonella sp.]HEX5683117.1 DNA polymerase III subunit gamma/tau [Ideonella sp.]